MDHTIDMLMVYGSNPIHSNCTPIHAIEAFKKIPFMVEIAFLYDETSQFCDILLPEIERLREARVPRVRGPRGARGGRAHPKDPHAAGVQAGRRRRSGTPARQTTCTLRSRNGPASLRRGWPERPHQPHPRPLRRAQAGAGQEVPHSRPDRPGGPLPLRGRVRARLLRRTRPHTGAALEGSGLQFLLVSLGHHPASSLLQPVLCKWASAQEESGRHRLGGAPRLGRRGVLEALGAHPAMGRSVRRGLRRRV